jgi:uncharacterized paraquat-inducible protein A
MPIAPIRCPHCGAAIPASLIPTSRTFYCPRCRSELQVAPPDPFSILLVSLALAIALCFVLGLRGFSFVAGLAAITATFYLFGGFVCTLVAVPRLKARSADKVPHGKRPHPIR